MRRQHVYLILWGVFLLALSFIPGREMPAQRFQPDKILHLLAFAYLGYLSSRTLGWWGLVAAVGFGAINEMQQLLVPGRQVAWLDLAANEAGALLGFFIGYLRRRREIQTG
ncbi:hypothetical protein GF338_06835 [candidate division WOR-3 bacterium]|nr:hypothetical protein [candidate division WOR-3 bacterium]